MFRGIPSRTNPPPASLAAIAPHHVEDDLVGNEFAAVEIRLDGPAETGPPRDVIAQQLTSADVRNAEMRGDQRALSPLARARRRDHQHSHYSSPAVIIPPGGRRTGAGAG